MPHLAGQAAQALPLVDLLVGITVEMVAHTVPRLLVAVAARLVCLVMAEMAHPLAVVLLALQAGAAAGGLLALPRVVAAVAQAHTPDLMERPLLPLLLEVVVVDFITQEHQL
jgi:hypothetical protein